MTRQFSLSLRRNRLTARVRAGIYLRAHYIRRYELSDYIRDYAGEIPGIMKAFVIFAIFFVAVQAEDYCYKDVARACKPTTNKQTIGTLNNCNARYGAIDSVLPDLQSYANTHLTRSFEYLLMSTHFANYEKNREGFEKLFRGLSDCMWSDAIELIKYVGKRGGKMNFSFFKDPKATDGDGNYELYELESMAKALDIQKQLAEEAFNIHGAATRRRKEAHDPEISSFIENEFASKHSKLVRELSGYTADLSSLLNGPDSSLALYLFDEYLSKQ